MSFFRDVFQITQLHDTLLCSVYLDGNKPHVVRAVSEYSRLHDHEFLELAYVLPGYHGGKAFEFINCRLAPEDVDRALINCPSLQTGLSTSLRQFGGDLLDGGPADCILHGSDGTIRRLMEVMLREYEQKQPIFSAGTWACPRASCGGLTVPWFELWK